jgi:GTP cyclohydrolase II
MAEKRLNNTNSNGESFLSKLDRAAEEYLDKKCLESGFNVEGIKGFSVALAACANLPTKSGRFTIVGFQEYDDNKEHTAIVHGRVAGSEDCPLRIHSQCHTGDVLGSLRCDCQDQLAASLEYIAAQPFGVVIYLQQEGRGIGLINKIRAYHLQDMGFDTVDANTCLGFPADARDYRVASEIIQLLNIKSVVLLTNNPHKLEGLEKEGIQVKRRIPLVIEANKYNRDYLKTKSKRMGHLF